MIGGDGGNPLRREIRALGGAAASRSPSAAARWRSSSLAPETYSLTKHCRATAHSTATLSGGSSPSAAAISNSARRRAATTPLEVGVAQRQPPASSRQNTRSCARSASLAGAINSIERQRCRPARCGAFDPALHRTIQLASRLTAGNTRLTGIVPPLRERPRDRDRGSGGRRPRRPRVADGAGEQRPRLAAFADGEGGKRRLERPASCPARARPAEIDRGLEIARIEREGAAQMRRPPAPDRVPRAALPRGSHGPRRNPA